MNTLLYNELVRLGVYSGPATDIARRFSNAEDTPRVIQAFHAHLRETLSLSLTVWRLQQGRLLTEGAAIDNAATCGPLPAERRETENERLVRIYAPQPNPRRHNR